MSFCLAGKNKWWFGTWFGGWACWLLKKHEDTGQIRCVWTQSYTNRFIMNALNDHSLLVNYQPSLQTDSSFLEVCLLGLPTIISWTVAMSLCPQPGKLADWAGTSTGFWACDCWILTIMCQSAPTSWLEECGLPSIKCIKYGGENIRIEWTIRYN